MPPFYERYVAIGDSTTEGLDDPDGAGGFRGWANRFAETIAARQGRLLYANLAIRGRRTRAILDEQLHRALAMQPDLSTVVSGTNDVLRPRFDPDALGRDIQQMQQALVQQGATVITFTLPDLSRVMPVARFLAARVQLMNAVLREASAASGAILVDVAKHEVASDPRLWSRDRLHANALGHERIAAALAHAIHLPGSDMTWADPLESDTLPPLSARVAEDLAWGREHLWPWVLRRARGKSSGEGLRCKRPDLMPLHVPQRAAG